MFRDIIWYNTSSDVTQWVSCIVGNVGTRFGKGRRMCGVKWWYLWCVCSFVLSSLVLFCRLHPQVFLVCYFSTSCLFPNIPSLVRPCFLFFPRVLCICFLCPLVCTQLICFLLLDYSCFVTSLLISASKRYLTKLAFCFSTCRPRCPESGSCNTISIIGVQSWTGFSKPETPR